MATNGAAAKTFTTADSSSCAAATTRNVGNSTRGGDSGRTSAPAVAEVLGGMVDWRNKAHPPWCGSY